MPTDWQTRKQQLRDRPPKSCDVPGCKLPAYKVGHLCLPHRRKQQGQGHPTAERVTLIELRPWRDLASQFIAKQEAAGHPGVLAAVEFLERLVRTAPDVADKAGRWTRPHERASIYFALLRRDAVDVRIVIAWGIACELHRMQYPKRWPDADHAAFQFGMAVACIARKRVRSGASTGRSQDAFKKSAGYVKELARQLRGPLLPLYVRAAHHLHTQIERATRPIPSAALQQPFITEEQP